MQAVKICTVPINQQIISALEKCLEATPTGSKLLVPDGVPTDKAINQLQQFILRNREAVQAPDSDRPLTFHGLRHTYAAEKLDAHLTVSRLLGHERADITNIYLSLTNHDFAAFFDLYGVTTGGLSELLKTA